MFFSFLLTGLFQSSESQEANRSTYAIWVGRSSKGGQVNNLRTVVCPLAHVLTVGKVTFVPFPARAAIHKIRAIVCGVRSPASMACIVAASLLAERIKQSWAVPSVSVHFFLAAKGACLGRLSASFSLFVGSCVRTPRLRSSFSHRSSPRTPCSGP